MAQVVIIGAGLTGLSTAYFLEQHQFFDYVLFEQASEIGGLCRSVRNDGFTFDYTGHFLHGAHDIMNIINTLMKPESWHVHSRTASVYSHGMFTPYPYQTNLHGLPVDTIIDCITGFVARKKIATKDCCSFERWVNNNFGKGFAKHFFFPYQEKIFDYPIQKLRSGWVGLVPCTTLTEILEGALKGKKNQPIGYNAHFLYPKNGGIDQLIKAFVQSLTQPIITQSAVVSIDPVKKTVMLSNGHVEHYEYLVSTMPLHQCLICLNMLQPAKKLICNNLININIGIKRSDVIDNHWVYYPEKSYPFFRIGFPHALNNKMCPQGYSSLSVEIASLAPVTPRLINAYRKKTLPHLMKLFNFQPSDIITEQILVLDHAYVIYDMWREKNLQKLLAQLASQSIFSVGRYGAWKYASMHEAIREGNATALKLIDYLYSTPLFKPARLDEQQKPTEPMSPHLSIYTPGQEETS